MYDNNLIESFLSLILIHALLFLAVCFAVADAEIVGRRDGRLLAISVNVVCLFFRRGGEEVVQLPLSVASIHPFVSTLSSELTDH